MKSLDIFNKIRDFIAGDNTEEALAQMKDALTAIGDNEALNELAIHASRFNRLQNGARLATIDRRDFEREKSNLDKSLLDMLSRYIQKLTHEELNRLYETNAEVFNLLPLIGTEIKSSLNNPHPLQLIQLYNNITDRMDTMRTLANLLKTFEVKETIEATTVKLKLLEFKDYCRNIVSFDNVTDALKKGYELQQKYHTKIEELRSANFSKGIISDFLSYGIDVGALVELKKDINRSLDISDYAHHCIIRGTDLFQTFVIEGKNNTDETVTHLIFSAAASLPTPKNEMEIAGYDVLHERKLGILCDEEDWNPSKKIKLFFGKPLRKGDTFNVKCSFLLKGTMTGKGKDFLIAACQFEQPVQKFSLHVSFTDNKPDFIKLLNLNEKQETLLFEDKDRFFYEETIENVSYLNEIRLILLFNR